MITDKGYILSQLSLTFFRLGGVDRSDVISGTLGVLRLIIMRSYAIVNSWAENDPWSAYRQVDVDNEELWVVKGVSTFFRLDSERLRDVLAA